MANLHQDGNSIINIQVVSSNCVHSNAYYQKFFLKKVNLTVRFLELKIAFFWGVENDNILSLKPYTVTKSGISPQRKLGSLQNLNLSSQDIS